MRKSYNGENIVHLYDFITIRVGNRGDKGAETPLIALRHHLGREKYFPEMGGECLCETCLVQSIGMPQTFTRRLPCGTSHAMKPHP